MAPKPRRKKYRGSNSFISTGHVQVAKYAASSKEEWDEQCKLWPTLYHPPTECAMARRIFYAFPNPNCGALGSVHRLQGEKNLHHHYAVFRVLLTDEVLDSLLLSR